MAVTRAANMKDIFRPSSSWISSIVSVTRSALSLLGQWHVNVVESGGQKAVGIWVYLETSTSAHTAVLEHEIPAYEPKVSNYQHDEQLTE